MITLLLAFFLGFGSSASWASPDSGKSLHHLAELKAEQEKEMARLKQILDGLPTLSYESAAAFAVSLAHDLKNVLEAVSRIPDEARLAAHLAEAQRLLEVASLLPEKIDLEDQKAARIDAYERLVNRRRLPVNVLFTTAGLVGVAMKLIRGQIPLYPIEMLDELAMPPFKVASDKEWAAIHATAFIATFKQALGAGFEALSIEPGLGGALKSRKSLSALLGQRQCMALLIPR